MIGCYGDAFHTNMGNGDYCDVNIEPKGNVALNIHEDAFIIAYLQVGEILIGFTPKESDHIVEKVKQPKWESNSFLQMWING